MKKRSEILVLILLLLFFIPGGVNVFAQKVFNHPGGLHTIEDLNRMKEMVRNGESPWIEGWNLLIKDPRAQIAYSASPMQNMGDNRQRASADAHAAYLNAIRWYISGDNAHAHKAIEICNAWSSTVNQVPSGNEILGLGGIPISEFALAAEVLRMSDLWQKEDFERFKHMMLKYLYPVCKKFLLDHAGRAVDYYWANWDACNIAALVAIGVLLDNEEIYNEGVHYYKYGKGNGSIKNAVPFIHPNGLGQWQESGRDQEHAQLGVGLLANVCQIAWNQGDDLYSYDNNRLLAGAEYVAQYNLMKEVPFKYYENSQGLNNRWPAINGRGQLRDRPLWEMIYNHYTVIKGLPAPNVERMAQVVRPEHGSKDHFGYGTLTFTREASPFPPFSAPATPQKLEAEGSVDKIYLKWNPSKGYKAQGYSILRAAVGEEFTEIVTYKENTINEYTDRTVKNGIQYRYRVAAINQAGESGYSEAACAASVPAGNLPSNWNCGAIGSGEGGAASYAAVTGGIFIVEGVGTTLGGLADEVTYAYQEVSGDREITCRIKDINGKLLKTGLMMRESLDPDAATVSMTLGDAGWRFARMGNRQRQGEKMSFTIGNAYTWRPAWFRLKRSGNTFTAFESSDGDEWFVVGKVEVEMTEDFYVGLVVCPGSDKEKNRTVFDMVTVANPAD